jgi:hypothetical protein
MTTDRIVSESEFRRVFDCVTDGEFAAVLAAGCPPPFTGIDGVWLWFAGPLYRFAVEHRPDAASRLIGKAR